jgi:hypothetical protein
MKRVKRRHPLILFLIFFLTDAGDPAAQTAFTSSNLPIVIIHTGGKTIPNDVRITASMGVICNGNGKRNSVTDAPNAYDGKISIEIRGSSSSYYRKKSYNAETQDDSGENLNVALIGFPAENDWILYGPYVDKSLMRNVLMYRLSNAMGRYASRTRFCEMVLNGEYQGVYVLMEKIKQDKNRVAIAGLGPDDLSGDALTGGYIIKADRGSEYFVSHFPPAGGSWYYVIYQFHDPDGEDLAPEQKAYIEGYMDAFEAAMNGPDFADPAKGYAKFIDVDSFVDHFLLNEICKNVDAYRLSSFFYKERDGRGGKLFAGPVWDMDLATGNANYYGAEDTQNWQLDNLTTLPLALQDTRQPPLFWKKLVREPGFARKIRDRWQELRAGVLQTDKVTALINAMADTLNEAKERNFEIWSGPGEGGEGWWPVPSIFYTFTTYRQEVDYLESWIGKRLNWMDANVGALVTGVADAAPDRRPSGFRLMQNHPNPFNPSTAFSYTLPEAARVTVEVLDFLGRRTAVLADREQKPGTHTAAWDASKAPSGVYFYRVTAGRFQETRKCVLMK